MKIKKYIYYHISAEAMIMTKYNHFLLNHSITNEQYNYQGNCNTGNGKLIRKLQNFIKKNNK